MSERRTLAQASGSSRHHLRIRTWVTASNHRRITAPHTRTFNHGAALVGGRRPGADKARRPVPLLLGHPAHQTHRLRASSGDGHAGLVRFLPDADLMPGESPAAVVLFASLLDARRRNAQVRVGRGRSIARLLGIDPSTVAAGAGNSSSAMVRSTGYGAQAAVGRETKTDVVARTQSVDDARDGRRTGQLAVGWCVRSRRDTRDSNRDLGGS